MKTLFLHLFISMDMCWCVCYCLLVAADDRPVFSMFGSNVSVTFSRMRFQKFVQCLSSQSIQLDVLVNFVNNSYQAGEPFSNKMNNDHLGGIKACVVLQTNFSNAFQVQCSIGFPQETPCKEIFLLTGDEKSCLTAKFKSLNDFVILNSSLIQILNCTEFKTQPGNIDRCSMLFAPSFTAHTITSYTSHPTNVNLNIPTKVNNLNITLLFTQNSALGTFSPNHTIKKEDNSKSSNTIPIVLGIVFSVLFLIIFSAVFALAYKRIKRKQNIQINETTYQFSPNKTNQLRNNLFTNYNYENNNVVYENVTYINTEVNNTTSTDEPQDAGIINGHFLKACYNECLQSNDILVSAVNSRVNKINVTGELSSIPCIIDTTVYEEVDHDPEKEIVILEQETFFSVYDDYEKVGSTSEVTGQQVTKDLSVSRPKLGQHLNINCDSPINDKIDSRSDKVAEQDNTLLERSLNTGGIYSEIDTSNDDCIILDITNPCTDPNYQKNSDTSIKAVNSENSDKEYFTDFSGCQKQDQTEKENVYFVLEEVAYNS